MAPWARRRWWVAFWLAAPGQMEREIGWWLKRSSWAWYAEQWQAGMLGVHRHCLAFLDFLFEGLLALPATSRRVLHTVQAARTPYERPAVLADEDTDPDSWRLSSRKLQSVR